MSVSVAKERAEARERRHRRARSKIVGTPERPRLCAFRSSKHFYAQVIDDTTGRVLAAASTQSPELKAAGKSATVEAAKRVGVLVAQKAKGVGVTRAVFDRAGYLFHGRVAAMAAGAREGGLEF